MVRGVRMIRTAFRQIWRWITFHEEPPKTEHERLMRKFSRGQPNNEGHTPVPPTNPGG